MKQRTLLENCASYKNYGERGINVCELWLNDFKMFYDWSMQNGYNEKLTIDRINNNGNYEPYNCRWATIGEQSNNKRSNHLITFNNKTQTMKQWSIETGVRYNTILDRLKKGWSIERVLRNKHN